jgi:hypothetical protein
MRDSEIEMNKPFIQIIIEYGDRIMALNRGKQPKLYLGTLTFLELTGWGDIPDGEFNFFGFTTTVIQNTKYGFYFLEVV